MEVCAVGVGLAPHRGAAHAARVVVLVAGGQHEEELLAHRGRPLAARTEETRGFQLAEAVGHGLYCSLGVEITRGSFPLPPQLSIVVAVVLLSRASGAPPSPRCPPVFPPIWRVPLNLVEWCFHPTAIQRDDGPRRERGCDAPRATGRCGRGRAAPDLGCGGLTEPRPKSNSRGWRYLSNTLAECRTSLSIPSSMPATRNRSE